MPENLSIYALLDPRDGLPHYIGKAKNPNARLESHLRDKNETRKTIWLNELRRLGLRPRQVILETVSPAQWVESEKKWISYGFSNDWPLTNSTCGGEGFSLDEKLSEMVRKFRALISPLPLEKLLSLPTQEKQELVISAALRGLNEFRDMLKLQVGESENVR